MNSLFWSQIVKGMLIVFVILVMDHFSPCIAVVIDPVLFCFANLLKLLHIAFDGVIGSLGHCNELFK